MKYRLEATRVTADAYAKMVVSHSLDLTCKTTTLQATAQSLAVSVLDLREAGFWIINGVVRRLREV